MSETIAPLLVKWLTHDLATPIAVVMTASEMLGDVADAEINALVSEAARRLAARLQLIRAAMAPGGSPVSGAALEKTLRAGLDSTPIDWAIDPDMAIDGARAAVIAGAAMLLADLRRGHPLHIGAGDARWHAAVALPDAVTAALAGGAPSDGRSAVAAMLAAAAGNAGLVLTATADGIAWR